MRFKLQHFFVYLVPIFILLSGILVLLAQPPIVSQTRNLIFDQYNRWHPRISSDIPVAYIDIDEASLARLGQFPWPRTLLAGLVDAATAQGAAVLAFDIMFPEPDRTAPENILPIWRDLDTGEIPDDWPELAERISTQIKHPDQQFADALSRSNVVIATTLSPDGSGLPAPKAGFAVRAHAQEPATMQRDPLARIPGAPAAISNQTVIQDAAIGLGAINARIDRDGIIRRVSLVFRGGDTLYPSLALEAIRAALGVGTISLRTSDVGGESAYSTGVGLSRLKVAQFITPVDADGSMRLYLAARETLNRISAWEVLAPDFDAARLAGKIVFIGTSAAGLKDIRATPLNPITPGVELHVQAVEQILSGSFLKRPLWLQFTEIGGALLLGIGIIALVFIFGIPSAIIGLAASALLAAEVSRQAYMTAQYLVDPVFPIAVIFAAFLVASFQHYIRTNRERREVRNAFQYYLSPDMIAEIAADPSRLKLGGETRDMTIMFTDIRGFTNLSETFKDAPETLTHIINIFLTRMTRIIQAHGGTIDKYIGDSIMAFWNAPTNLDNHAYIACCTALEMNTALVAVNADLHAEEQLAEWTGNLAIGIGVNSGDTLVGNMGSDQRFNYSVLGDPVNVSARLEGQTKNYFWSMLVGEATYRAAMETGEVNGLPLAFLEFDLIAFKGKNVPEHIYALMGDNEICRSASFAAHAQAHNAMLAHLRARAWDETQKAAAALAHAHPELAGYYDMMHARCDAYRENPPAETWDGRYIARTK